MENSEKTQRQQELIIAIEETRKKLRQPGAKLAITYYDYFMLALFVVVMLGEYSLWFFLMTLFWERPRIIFKNGVLRVRQDKEMRTVLKQMYKELRLEEERNV